MPTLDAGGHEPYPIVPATFALYRLWTLYNWSKKKESGRSSGWTRKNDLLGEKISSPCYQTKAEATDSGMLYQK
jgi:hypothetical protein